MKRATLAVATLALTAAVLVAPQWASAQSDSRRFPGRTPENTIRVSAQFQAVIPMTGGNEAEQETATTKARARLYETAQRECEVLKGVFSGECKIININVSTSMQNSGVGIMALRLNINASYIITPKEQ